MTLLSYEVEAWKQRSFITTSTTVSPRNNVCMGFQIGILIGGVLQLMPVPLKPILTLYRGGTMVDWMQIAGGRLSYFSA